MNFGLIHILLKAHVLMCSGLLVKDYLRAPVFDFTPNAQESRFLKVRVCSMHLYSWITLTWAGNFLGTEGTEDCTAFYNYDAICFFIGFPGKKKKKEKGSVGKTGMAFS